MSPCNSFGCDFGRFLQALIGLALLSLGGIMIITFWLLPVGIPVALVGVAMSVADTGNTRHHPSATQNRDNSLRRHEKPR